MEYKTVKTVLKNQPEKKKRKNNGGDSTSSFSSDSSEEQVSKKQLAKPSDIVVGVDKNFNEDLSNIYFDIFFSISY